MITNCNYVITNWVRVRTDTKQGFYPRAGGQGRSISRAEVINSILHQNKPGSGA